MKILVWGTGSTGIETTREMLRQGHEVRLVDEKPFNGSCEFPVGLLSEEDIDWAELVIPSPGIAREHSMLQRAKRVLSEIEVAASLMSGKLIAVTGTNGKTTTVTLIHRVLKAAGLNAGLGGNINPPLITLVKDQPDYIVAEISSFQLEWIENFRPAIAVCLNVTPDHLDRYGAMDEYVHYKLAIFKNQQGNDLALVNLDDAWLKDLSFRCRRAGFALNDGHKNEPGGYVKDGRIYYSPDTPGPRIPDMNLIGEGVAEDMLATALVCHEVGVSDAVMEAVFDGFKVIHHRFEFVAEIDGVTYIDDSKATNVGALEKALSGISKPTVLILGGVDKGGDFRTAIASFRDRIKQVVLLGDKAPRILSEIDGLVPIEKAASMAEAVNQCRNAAVAGDIVLLSPGCASFDLFKSYAHRGEVFAECVKELTVATN